MNGRKIANRKITSKRKNRRPMIKNRTKKNPTIRQIKKELLIKRGDEADKEEEPDENDAATQYDEA